MSKDLEGGCHVSIEGMSTNLEGGCHVSFEGMSKDLEGGCHVSFEGMSKDLEGITDTKQNECTWQHTFGGGGGEWSWVDVIITKSLLFCFVRRY
jgi:hypothetical protein